MPAPPKPRVRLEDLVLRHGMVNEEQLARAREEQQVLGGELGRVLVDLGFLSEGTYFKVLAHQLGIPLVDPSAMPVGKQLLQAIPVQLCERYGVIAVGVLGPRTVRLATSHPSNAATLQAIESATGLRVEPALAHAEKIELAIRRHYYGEEPEAPPPEAQLEELQEVAPEPAAEELPEDAVVLPASADELAELRERVDRIERLAGQSSMAAILARLDRVEQTVSYLEEAVRGLSDLLADVGFTSREELQRRTGLPPRRPPPGSGDG